MAEALGRYRKLYAAGIIEGRRINSVSLQAEAWFWRLLVLADDYGNLPADPDLLRGRAAPMRKMTTGQIRKLNAELESASAPGRPPLMTRYTVDGEEFFRIDGFERMQTPSNGKKVQRYPLDSASKQIQSDPDKPDGSGSRVRARPSPDQTRPTQPSPDLGGHGTVAGPIGSGGRVGGATSALSALGVNPSSAEALAAAGVTCQEIEATLADIRRSGATVKTVPGLLVHRLSEAHGVKIPKAKAIGRDARELLNTIENRRQRA